jgi:predicted PurR-regulated permease PerM
MIFSEQPLYYRATITLLLLALIIAFLILAENILIPLTIAVFFTFLLLPISRKLEQWHFPKTLSIHESIILAFAVVGALLYFFVAQDYRFVDEWPFLEEAMTSKLESIQQFISETFHVSRIDQKAWITTKIKENASTGGVLVLGLFSATTSFLASFALIPIYIFFLSLYREKFKHFILHIGKGGNEQALMVVRKVSQVSQKYVTGIFMDIAILSTLNSVGFMIIGLPHALLFGVLISLLNVIPYIGVLIGSALPILIAFLTFDAIGYTIAVAGVCIAVQFLDNNFITPYVVGSSVSINPLTATIALIASSLIWGIPGMILCIPLTGMAKVVCDNIESLKPYGYLLGEEAVFGQKKEIQQKVARRFKKKANKQD